LSGTSAHPVWVLLGRRTGDNNQLIAAALALGLPFEMISLKFKGPALPNVLLGASLHSLANPEAIPAGSPRLVLSIGRRSPAVARWIRKRSGGVTKLVHFGRPWGRAQWFDLVVTTAQYGLEPAPNVICNVLPFLRERERTALPGALHERLEALPRPWTVLLAGGNSRPYRFGADVARALADRANELAQAEGGSLLFLRSPRTPEACAQLIAGRLRGPHYVYQPQRDDNPYLALLDRADRFIVTSDSALMVAEALSTARPVEVFRLPREPDWRYRFVSGWNALAEHNALLRVPLRWLQRNGLITSTRELEGYYQRLDSVGAFSEAGAAATVARAECERTIARIRELLEPKPGISSPRA
jgi:mitochondrial fission protein ELM1